MDDGIDAGGPGGAAPRLDDSMAGVQLDMAAFDLAAEEFEGSAGARVDLGGRVGEGAELLRVEQGFVDAGGGGFEVDLLGDGRGGLFGLGVCRSESDAA